MGEGGSVGNQAEVIASYDQYYLDPWRLRDSDAFYRWVLDKLAPGPGAHLLDIACGGGHLLRFAAARGLVVQGIDISTGAVRLTREGVGEGVALIADGEHLPFQDGTYDYLTNLGSLEHFDSPEQGLLEMRRVLRPGGRVALVLPNSYYLLDILWHVWRRGYPVSHKQTIERFATYGEWRDLIETHGFQVERAFKYNLCWPRSRADVRYYVRYPRKVVYLLLSPFTPFNLSYSFLYVCRAQ
jgi:ubiquinone/menaquinone biosynthesis C-methylase UbiE